MGIDADPELVRIIRHSTGIPQYTVGHLDRLARAESTLSAYPGVLLAGNSYRGVSINACIAEAAKDGKVGIVGYCWGGTVAWVAAARLDGLACSVPYYGGGIPDFADEKPVCPVMFHFAEKDQRPTAEQARQIAAAHPSALAHFYDAGHGFNCDQRGSYDAPSVKLARERTLEFLKQHVG